MKSIWYKNQNNHISVSGLHDQRFKGYYRKYPLNSNDLVELPDFITGSEKGLFTLATTFSEVGTYMIKIVDIDTNQTQHETITVNEDTTNQIINKLNDSSDIINFKLTELKTIILSEQEGLVKIIKEISNLPDDSDISSILLKIDNLQTKVNQMKKKTTAFINKE